MGRLVTYIVRLAVILFGYAVASLAVSAFVHVLFLAREGYNPALPGPMTAAPLVLSVLFVALFAARLVFVPAALVILIGEVLGRRDWLFYALGGAVITFVSLAFMPDAAYVETSARLEITGSGMVGGIFYWLAAGRWAGSWWKNDRPATSPGPSGS
ncbi:hypothetical protein [Mesorhizobium opportunistum]|uniref:Transmembrane protein n=1 Tax=Mesorhizobium opportunistum (strain LMG 24607 / HAMBI 3007 / WSM2075) TaxID=536019 RepID=F7YB65_MESOW|nr:hypothetical protein [Mesorhizobium opportunistum]AEH85471.1 conserved hypothetical protein [Mesorhizobium opportunistum WSM2075]